MANEERLIDANALRERHCKGCKEDIREMCLVDPICASLMWVDEEPTVDAVEVVRCKDCKHYNVYRLECHNAHMNGYIGIDGFCSYGERRTDV